MKGGRQPFEFLTHLDHEGVSYADDEEKEEHEQRQKPQRSPKHLSPPPHRQSSFELQDLPVEKEEVPPELNNNDGDGVFAMTGLGEEDEGAAREKPHRPTSTLRSKHFATVSLRVWHFFGARRSCVIFEYLNNACC